MGNFLGAALTASVVFVLFAAMVYKVDDLRVGLRVPNLESRTFRLALAAGVGLLAAAVVFAAVVFSG
jgi:hypothetical protein